MPPSRHASIDVIISFWLTILFTSTAIAAHHQPSAHQCGSSLPLLLRRCHKIEANYYRKEFRRREWIGRHSWLIPRGGGQQQHGTEILAAEQVIPLSSLPLIDTTSVSLALRLACETNRRLHRGTSIAAGSSTDFSSSQHTLGHKAQQHYTSSTLCTHTIRSVSESEQIEERRKDELTVFHRVELEDRAGDKRHGNSTESVMSWGPDLESYLQSLLCAIGINKDSSDISNKSSANRAITHNKSPMEDETQVILSLTILYLDRSTSPSPPLYVNPLTGQHGYPQCPHVLPQTVHRLLLTALSIATKFVRGDKATSNTLREAANSMMDERHAVSLMDMEKMEDWMIYAMSSTTGMHAIHHHHHQYHHHEISWQISHEEISRLLRKWGGTFYPQRLAAHDQTRMEQQERLWSEQLGANHGHGNFWADRSISTEYPSTHGGEHPWQYPGHH